ncbi:unnamed protein product [Mycena citricolor]|uniref:Uncharacterized protein n=1 Tax=Mycena citricolor TaxID=2018698 RepID=A0AAD2HRW8_9AGAR|nr:unnamed protein product [Mycena citricolor]CAK5280993.1 unnamed protein product [Mycena citricolor]
MMKQVTAPSRFTADDTWPETSSEPDVGPFHWMFTAAFHPLPTGWRTSPFPMLQAASPWPSQWNANCSKV